MLCRGHFGRSTLRLGSRACGGRRRRVQCEACSLRAPTLRVSMVSAKAPLMPHRRTVILSSIIGGLVRSFIVYDCFLRKLCASGTLCPARYALKGIVLVLVFLPPFAFILCSCALQLGRDYNSSFFGFRCTFGEVFEYLSYIKQQNPPVFAPHVP